MTFDQFRLKPKPEHIQVVLEVLSKSDLITIQAIAKDSGLSHTTVKCALDQLEKEERLVIVRQQTSPKIRIKLKEETK